MSPPDRKAPCPCGSGRRYQACCRPRDRALEDGEAAARAAHELVDGVVRLVVARVESSGATLACRAGCHACCSYLIRASRVEALPIARFLLEHEEARRRFEEAYPRWRAAVGPALAEIEAMFARHHGAPSEDAGEAELGRWHARVAEAQLAAAACPLLDPDGRCGVYPVRPVVCRAWNVTGTAAHCAASSATPPEAVSDPAIDDAMARARGAMVHAGRGLPAPDDAALPTQVARALAELRR